ncbi:kinase-like protein [Conidiobolus coronatus NRRL 28638]|uniref:non-specific serine/threonine protein kinase n=1 Tax=Conidiobolus coronatus (strain ATCC 28846 / CBS 209.66 / NRRL 28638) TaxID=796925 RepID=A0A137PDZ8_CONC2|nr:kinase-like protein [Conidiobolus coronatus NRRL 28638]|eukprot:KXN73226.1 kinase-like protein [Conidiobolus coronatus NRRL 28638]
MHPSTRRKCAAAQVYFLDYYYDLLNYLYERKNRLKTFNKFVEDENLKQDEEEKEWTRHCGRERAYLRKRRVRIRLEQFHVLFQIGQGGYGQVFLATKKDTQEVCALKQMNKRTLHKYDEIGHILNERDVLTASKGEWLVKLLYAFQDVDHVYLAMEFVPGGDMRTLLNSNGMLLDCHARFYIAEMVTAVDALHQLGYIHRDLKPENFLIDGTGHVKLADFGLSKGSLSSKRVASLRKRLDSIKHKQLTHLKASEKRTFHDSMRKGDYIWHFSVVGSPEYMAPEILEGAEKDGGSPYDHKVDYWSLGCILYEYLAGFPPFTSPNPDEVWLNLYRWQEVLERPIFEDQTLNDNFTDLAWDLIKHMLAHADTRYASLDKFKLHPYFKEIPWHNLRNSEPPFVPQLESETDPSYFDDFSKADTIQQIYASIERRDLQRHSPIADDGVSFKSSSSDPLNTPLRAAFVGFTYRHKARHFTPPSSSAPKVAPYLNTLL